MKQKRIIRNQQDFTERIGYDKSTVSQIMNDRVAVPNRMIENICIAFPMINERWLLTGEGSMLNPQPQTVNGHYVTGSHNNIAGQNLIIGDSAGQAQNKAANNGTTSALVKVPVVPPLITDLPNIDILEYLKNKRDNISYAPIIVDDVQLVMWFTVDDNVLLPLFRRGDMVGLIEEPHDAITGKVYVIDTYPYGMLFRRVVADATSDNLLLRSLNKDDYPDISIKKSDIIRLYKIMWSGCPVLEPQHTPPHRYNNGVVFCFFSIVPLPLLSRKWD